MKGTCYIWVTFTAAILMSVMIHNDYSYHGGFSGHDITWLMRRFWNDIRLSVILAIFPSIFFGIVHTLCVERRRVR